MISDLERELALLLIENVENKQMNITYQEAAEELTKRLGRKIRAHGQLGAPLDTIARACAKLQLPLITVRVVNSNPSRNKRTGDGFYEIACELKPEYQKYEKEPEKIWKRENDLVRKCREWDRLQVYMGGETEKKEKQEQTADTANEPKEHTRVATIEEAIIPETEQVAAVQARIGQELFRKQLMQKYPEGCIMTGIQNEKLLVASHIKPWADSNNHERLLVDNGLLLSATYDRLFDSGLITFDNKGHLILSAALSQEDARRLNLNAGTVYDLKMTPKMEEFLAYHNQNIFITE